MPFDFPNNPTNGQTVTSPGGTYKWDGVKWTPAGGGSSGGGATVIIGDTPPANPVPSELWWDSVGGNLFIYFQDPNSSEWVITNTGTGGGAAGLPDAPNDGSLYGRQSAAWAKALSLTGGTLTGPLTLSANAASALQPTTLQQMNAAITGINIGNYLPLSGGTMTGGIHFGNAVASSAVDLTRHLDLNGGAYGFNVTANQLNYVTGLNHVWYNYQGTWCATMTTSILQTAGAIYAGNDLHAPGRTYTNDMMNVSGIFYVANNYNYYMGRSGNDGAWRFVENGTINGTIDTGGNYTARSSVIANGNCYGGGTGGSVLGTYGMIAQAVGLGYWMAFNWDGTNVPAYANGGYACTLVSSGWCGASFKSINAYTPNQNVDNGANVTFNQVICNYLQAGGSGIDAYNTVQCVAGWGVRYFSNCPYGTNNAFVFGWQNISAGLVTVSVDGGAVAMSLWDAAQSDERAKFDIEPSTLDCLDMVRKLPLVSYRWKEVPDPWQLKRARRPKDAQRKQVGMIAQQVHKIFPDAVIEGDNFDDHLGRLWGINISSIMAMLIGACKQLDARVAELEAR